MSAQPKSDSLESKLNEFDEIMAQWGSSLKIVNELVINTHDTSRRINNRSRNGKGIGEQLSQLHKNFEEMPDAFRAISDITKRLSELSAEIDAQILKSIPQQ